MLFYFITAQPGSPQDLLKTAFAHKASFAPGKKWEYSNTGYIVLGLLIEKIDGKLVDITNLDPSWGGAAGQLIATPSDLNRFWQALMDGKLLKPAQLKAMKKTVKAPGMPAGWEYGLGLMKMPVSCGTAWGHGGDIDGYETRGGVTDKGGPSAACGGWGDLGRAVKDGPAEPPRTESVTPTRSCRGACWSRRAPRG
ncbi:serine hydrolase domain-containing protein [Nonomuraea sp. B1E8]|uniref:serine hydrolase domain-containing protein n=1 Tax=unclassified Nonomuraea TaxID=2593643 RepID=UPI00325F2BFA